MLPVSLISSGDSSSLAPQQLSLEDIQLPFDTPKSKSYDVDNVKLPVASRKRRNQRRGRRQSADFEVMSGDIIISPDTAALPEIPKVSSRSSSRLRRKSIEIYKQRQSLLEQEQQQQQQQLEQEAEEKDESSVCDADMLPLEHGLQDVQVSMDHENVQQHDQVEEEGEQSMNTSNVEKDLVSCADETAGNSPSQRKSGRKRKSVQLSEDFNAALAIAAEPAVKKTKRTRKNAKDTNVEDIYLNKLWKSQMPKDRTWETIYESPDTGKSKGRKLRRAINPEDFYTTAKLKRRRNKAMKQGWKPLSKKKLEKAEILLHEKLATLNEELNDE